MEIVDANIVLRYFLNDHKHLYRESRQIIEKKVLYIPTEVVAEIVYVLEKVYTVPRDHISEALEELFKYQNITTTDASVLFESLNVYKVENIDFVDALLVSCHRVNGDIIHSFDKKVRKLCKSA